MSFAVILAAMGIGLVGGGFIWFWRRSEKDKSDDSGLEQILQGRRHTFEKRIKDSKKPQKF